MRATAVSACVALALTLSPAVARAASVPGTTCAVFGPDNVWNMDVSGLPVNSHSRTWKRSMAAGSTLLHPDFGAPPYGIPYTVVDGSHAKVSVSFQYASESDAGPYPFDANTPVEQGSDRHALMVGTDCVL